jgi:hypothetical protein
MLQDAFKPYPLEYAGDFRDCLFRTNGIIDPAIEMLKLIIENADQKILDDLPLELRKLSFTVNDDNMLKSGNLAGVIIEKGKFLVKERIEYLGYRIIED